MSYVYCFLVEMFGWGKRRFEMSNIKWLRKLDSLLGEKRIC